MVVISFFDSSQETGAFLVAQLVKNLPVMQETWLDSWVGKITWRRDRLPTIFGLPCWAQIIKNPSAMRDTWVGSLGWEDPLEEGMATHSSLLAWRIPKGRGAWQATVHGVTKSRTWVWRCAKYSTAQPGDYLGASASFSLSLSLYI